MAEPSVAFDRAADFYDQTRGFPAGEEHHVAHMVAQAGNFEKDSSLLEIGVGTGRIALPVSAYVAAYIGVDLSRPMMNKLRGKHNSQDIYLAEADATRLPFGEATFDGTVVSHVFHLIPNWQTALTELRRVLRPDAPLVHIWSKDEGVFHPLWDAWNNALPAQAETTYGVPWRTQPNYLEDEGWRPNGEALTHLLTGQTSLQKFLDQVKERIWSSCWRYTDGEMARGMAAMEAVIPNVFPERETPINTSTTVYARAYLPPR